MYLTCVTVNFLDYHFNITVEFANLKAELQALQQSRKVQKEELEQRIESLTEEFRTRAEVLDSVTKQLKSQEANLKQQMDTSMQSIKSDFVAQNRERVHETSNGILYAKKMFSLK